MKKILIGLLTLVLVFAVVTTVKADKPTQVDSNGIELSWSNSSCPDIQSGTILDSNNNTITTGYDQYGYNYQAHMFNGTYDSSDRNLDGTYWGQNGDFVDDNLMMKWSDSWLANVDCDGNHKLDRGLLDGSFESDGISKGWLTNHVEGDYTEGGITQHYTDFVKIVWTGPGSDLWDEYTIIEEVWNDPAGGYNGLMTKIDAPGFGLNDQWTTTP